MPYITLKRILRFIKQKKKDSSPGKSNALNEIIFTNTLIKDTDIEIGDFTYGWPIIYDYEKSINYSGKKTKIKIGKFCSIADGVVIMKGGNHNINVITTYPLNILYNSYQHINVHPTTKGNITIGNDVWIGREAIILSGVNIGDGAVIGTRTVVSKDVPPYSIVVGNPGRIIKMRFDEETVKFLLNIQWWNFPEEKIKKITPFLLSQNIHELKIFLKNDTKNY